MTELGRIGLAVSPVDPNVVYATVEAANNQSGIFRSNDRGATWQLNEALWDKPEREKWFGGGYDNPGIHSICVDPRDSKHITVAVSIGGVWITRTHCSPARPNKRKVRT